jgi:hypothetical protein
MRAQNLLNTPRWAGNIPAILAFSLLVFQASIPWTVPHFVTQDGASHLYAAIVARDLLLHPHSDYAAAYAFNPRFVPSWGCPIILGAIAAVCGAAHAEPVFASLAIIAGFFAFAYAIRALSPDANRWTPLTNFLLQPVFLWLGFYNFYLAMVLSQLLIGYYSRHAAAFTARRIAVLASGMAALILIHLMGAVLAGLAVFGIAVWVNMIASYLLPTKRELFRIRLRRLAAVGLAFVPALTLFCCFAGGQRIALTTGFAHALEAFPMEVFTSTHGGAGDQSSLTWAVLCLIVLAMLMMRRADWATAHGGLAVSAVLAFLAYLIVPDEGLGGSMVKIRFVWGVFLLGGLLLAATARLRPWFVLFEVYVCVLLATSLVSNRDAVRGYSRAVDDYLVAAAQVPREARLVRLRYATPDLPARYGFEGIVGDPLLHADAYVAAQCGCLDLSDQSGPAGTFPIALNRAVPEEQRRQLWLLERPGADAGKVLRWLQSTLPVAINYVIVVGDQSTPDLDQTPFRAVLGQLNSEMRLAGTSGGEPFVHVYQWNQAQPVTR